ncbi:hypothetical protein [Mycobacterium sp. HNNTM2301]|uniref:DUF7159 family protein n=1 Tax=Mycobacterium hainanense TaxID=3289775 RepID=UPI0035A697E9
MDIVLGVSMAPASIQMVVLEGEYADGVTVEEDVFDVSAADKAATASASDQVLAAILGTREGAADAGLEVSSIGVTWTDQLEAAALRDALAAYRIENVMLVSAFLAATALAQNVGGAMGYERTAIMFVEPDTATLAVVETSDGSIPDVYKQPIYADSYDQAAAQLGGMIAGLEKLQAAPDGVLVVGSGVDIAPLKPALQTATPLEVSVPEEPETALARGAALASANAPLFASSTAALAYAQDPGTGAVDQYSLPEYLYAPFAPEAVDDELAYSAVPDEDADSPTVVIEKLFMPEESEPRRRPALLIGSGLAVAGISAVLALEIALAIGIRTTGTVALQPTPGQHLIVPTQQAPAPVEASAPAAKLNLPEQVAAPKPMTPQFAAPLPAAPPPPAAPPIPAAPAPVVPVPVVVPPIAPVILPPVRVPVPNPVLTPPVIQGPPHVSPPPVLPQPPVHVPEPPQTGGTGPQWPPRQTPPGQGSSPPPSSGTGGSGGGLVPPPGSGPGGSGGGHVPPPGSGPGGSGGGHVPPPGSGPGGSGGGHVPPPGSGPGGLGGGHSSPPGDGGLGGGHLPTPGSGGGAPSGPGGLFGGGPLGGGHGGGPVGGGAPGGGFGIPGGGHSGGAPGGGLGGFGGGHSGGAPGGGLGGFGGGHSGGGGGFGGGGGGGGGHSGGGGGGHK